SIGCARSFSSCGPRNEGSSALLASVQEQSRADRDAEHAGPYRDVHGLVLAHCQFNRSELGFLRVLRVAEAAEHERDHTCDDEHDPCELDGIHFDSPMVRRADARPQIANLNLVDKRIVMLYTLAQWWSCC